MKRLFIFAALVLAAAVSCTKEIAPVEKINVDVVPDNYVPVTLSAAFDAGTKVVIDDKKVLWEVGEEVAVFADGAGSPIKFSVVECAAGEKGVNAKIAGAVPEGTKTFTAVYPYQAALSIAEGVVSVDIPAEQTITEGRTYDSQAFPSVAYYADAESVPVFRNVMSLVTFNVGQTEGVSEVRIYYDGTVNCAGEIAVAVDKENAAPEIENKCEAPYVSVICVGGFEPGVTYTAAVAPAKSAGVSSISFLGNKAGMRQSANELVMERNKGKNLGDLTEKAVWSYFQISNAEELKDFLAVAKDLPKAWTATLSNDIDCSDVEIGTAESYAGVFDGQGCKLINWTSNAAPLFVTVTGTVKDFTIDASCKLNLPATMTGNIGFVACNNKGVVSGITNNADISGDVVIKGGYAAAIIGRCDATGLGHGITVADCVNNGNITINTTANTGATQYVGTIMGSMGANAANVIKDCTNNGNLTINCSGTNTKNFYIGGITGGTTNNSNNVNLINNGDVTLKCAGHEAALCLAGISSYTTGNITNCENNGNISFLSEGRLKATFVAGLAGYFADRTVSNSVNRGDVTISATAIGGRNNIGGLDAAHSYTVHSSKYHGVAAGLTIGGLVSATGYNNPTFEGCSNYGKVTLTLTDPMNNPGSHTAARPSMGGLVGDCAGPMTDCHNYGDVTVTFGTASFTATNAGYTPYVGGIVGSSYNFSGATSDGGTDWNAKNKFTLTNCTNSGNVTLVNYNTHTTNNAVGGICGWPQSENTSAVYIAKNCSNSGDISFVGNAKVRVGGIHGGTGRMDGCSNTGNISVESAQKESVAGSVAGFQSQTHTFSNCTAGGKVEAKSLVNGLGGLVGQIGNYAFTGMDGCSVNCELIGGPEGKTGLIIGSFNGTTKKIVLGSAEDPIEIAGSIDGTAVSEENVQTYFCGNTGMSLDNHTVYYSLNGKSHRHPACIAEAIYIGNSQSIYNSETWTVNLHQQYVIKLDAEGELVTLVLNKKGQLDGDAFNFFPVDKVPTGTFEIDATGVHADNTFSIQSASGEEKYYTGLVQDGHNVPIYDGEIVVKEDNGTYTVNAVLVDDAAKQYEYSYVGALAISGNDFRAGGAEVNWKNTSSTHFTTKANEWYVSFYMPRKNPADTEPAYASFTFYTAAGEVDLNDVPDGTYTYGVAEADATLKYSNGITKANPGLLSAVSVSLYNAAGLLQSTEVDAESTVLTISKNADGTKKFNYSASVKPYSYDGNYNKVYGDPVQVNIDIDVPLSKASDTNTHPCDDKDAEFTSLVGPAGTVYVGYWYSKYIGQENDAPKEAIPGTDCNIFAFGSNSNFNNSWSMMISVIAEAGWTFEKNYANRFCSNPVPDGTYTFGTEAKIGALIPLRYSTASRCYVKNTYTGTTYYPVAGTVVLSNGTITVDLTCKATEASLEGRPNSPASVHFTGSTAFTCSYLQDYSALSCVKNLSINSPVPVE